MLIVGVSPGRRGGGERGSGDADEGSGGCFARLASAQHCGYNGDHDDDGNQDHDDGNRIADRIDVRASHRVLLAIAHTILEARSG